MEDSRDQPTAELPPLQLVSGFRCRKCGRSDIGKLPSDGISRHPGYECARCGYVMAAGQMKLMYLLGSIAGLLIAAAGVNTVLSGGHRLGGFGFGFLAVLVGLYCVRELFRPTPINDPSARPTKRKAGRPTAAPRRPERGSDLADGNSPKLTVPPLTRAHIDELLAFLPEFDPPSDRLVSELPEPADEFGDEAVPDPVYPAGVQKFIRLATQEHWSRIAFNAWEAAALLSEPAAIGQAGLEDVRRVLAHLGRAERRRAGHWGEAIRGGQVGLLLRRLQELRATAAEPA